VPAQRSDRRSTPRTSPPHRHPIWRKVMADQTTPASRNQAPDPATSYGREKPEKEAGMGPMTAPVATPQHQPDQTEQAVKNRQDGTPQHNAPGTVAQARAGTAGPSHPS